MAYIGRNLVIGLLAAVAAAPAALADDCVETVKRVPMMSPLGAAPGAAPPRMSRITDAPPPRRATTPRVAKLKPARVAKAQARKAHKPKAVAHKASAPKRRLAKRRAAPTRLAALAAPKGYPDARLMMTRVAPAAAQPDFALIRTTVCTTGVPTGGRLMPLLGAPGDGIGPTETFLDGQEPGLLPPPPEPPFPYDEPPVIIPPIGPPLVPPGPPVAPPAAIPEPTTWALLIAGFGLAGAGLRRRRGRTAA